MRKADYIELSLTCRNNSIELEKGEALFSKTLVKTYVVPDGKKIELCIGRSESHIWGKICIAILRRPLCCKEYHRSTHAPRAYFTYNQKQYKHVLSFRDSGGNQHAVYKGYDLRRIGLFLTSWLQDHEQHCKCSFFLEVKGEILGTEIYGNLSFRLKESHGKRSLHQQNREAGHIAEPGPS